MSPETLLGGLAPYPCPFLQRASALTAQSGLGFYACRLSLDGVELVFEGIFFEFITDLNLCADSIHIGDILERLDIIIYGQPIELILDLPSSLSIPILATTLSFSCLSSISAFTPRREYAFPHLRVYGSVFAVSRSTQGLLLFEKVGHSSSPRSTTSI